MDKEKSTSDTKEQTKQIADRMEYKKKLNTVLDKIITNPIVKLLGWLFVFAIILKLIQFILIMLIQIVPHSFVQDAMLINNKNSTTAEMHISVANNLLLSAITFVYVILTWNLAKESKNSIAQSKKEQQIRDIENKLEKFYIPADDIINLKHRHKERTINGFVRNDNQFVQGLKHLRKYSYLADNETYKAYEKYMSTECTNPKSTTCTDTYKNGEFTKCEYHQYMCETNFATCPHNLIYCKYNPDDPKTNNGEYESEKNKCTSYNTNCNYINDLKDAITEDIERYKGKLSDLKE